MACPGAKEEERKRVRFYPPNPNTYFKNNDYEYAFLLITYTIPLSLTDPDRKGRHTDRQTHRQTQLKLRARGDDSDGMTAFFFKYIIRCIESKRRTSN